tara:strand:+ start:441 stop:1505 length:1065 start_codon:yes stop_codon:yes gene_type:complete
MISELLSLKFFENNIKKFPICLIDCGASGGIDSIFSDITNQEFTASYGFEPNPEEYKKLKSSSKIKYFPYAITDTSGKKIFYAYKSQGSLSIQESFKDGTIKKKERKKIKKINVRSETIESLYKKKIINCPPNIIKTDIEGYDYYALKGGNKFFESDDVLAVKFEFSWKEDSKNGDFSKLHSFLNKNEYYIFGMTYGQSIFGFFQHGDALYLKSIDRILTKKKSKKKIRNLIFKLILISVNLRLYEYANLIIIKSKNKKIITLIEFEELKKVIETRFFLPEIFYTNKLCQKISLIFFFIVMILNGVSYRKKSVPKYNQLIKPKILFSKYKFFKIRNYKIFEKLAKKKLFKEVRY